MKINKILCLLTTVSFLLSCFSLGIMGVNAEGGSPALLFQAQQNEGNFGSWNGEPLWPCSFTTTPTDVLEAGDGFFDFYMPYTVSIGTTVGQFGFQNQRGDHDYYAHATFGTGAGNKSGHYDLSACTEYDYAVFELMLQEGFDTDNLYFALSFGSNDKWSKNAKAVDFNSYADISKIGESQIVAIPIKEFIDSVMNYRYGHSWDSSVTHANDFQYFDGMGFIRTNANLEEGEGLTTSNSMKVYTMQIVQVKPVTDFAAAFSSENDAISLSWTPSVTSEVSGYNIYRKDAGTATPSLLAENIFPTDTSYTDVSIINDVDYTYYIEAVANLTYGESNFSYMSTIETANIFSGDVTQIPEDSSETKILNFDLTKMRNNDDVDNTQIAGEALTSLNPFYAQKDVDNPQRLYVFKCFTSIDSITYKTKRPDDYTDNTWLRFNMKYGQVMGAQEIIPAYDHYWLGAKTNTENNFSESYIKNTLRKCVCLVDYQDGSVVYTVFIDENVDLNNLYVYVASNYNYWTSAVGTVGVEWGYNSNDNDLAVVALPITNYITESDKGKLIDIVVPISDFNNIDSSGRLTMNRVAGKYGHPEYSFEFNWRYFSQLGFMRYDRLENPDTSDQYIYCKEFSVVKAKPVENVAYELDEDCRPVISWTHSEKADHYNIYLNNEKIAETKYNKFKYLGDWNKSEDLSFAVEAAGYADVSSEKSGVDVNRMVTFEKTGNTVTANVTADAGMNVYFARYDASNQLLLDIIWASADADNTSIPLQLSDCESDDVLRVFVWRDNMAPYYAEYYSE